MKSLGKIGFFDSGVGGVTVLKAVKKLLPNEDVLYYGDTFFSPYGEKTKEEIEERCIKIANYLVENGCKAIVIACNTATVAALDILKKTMPVPVIGVISPGARAAVLETKNCKIGILATVFTVKNLAYTKEIEKINKDCKVYESGCKVFCPMIEEGWEKFPDRLEYVKEYLGVLPNDIDTLVLGCTHYPLIKNDIEKFYKGNIIDPAFETAKELKEILEKEELLNTPNNKSNVEFVVSGELAPFKLVLERFWGESVENLKNNKV